MNLDSLSRQVRRAVARRAAKRPLVTPEALFSGNFIRLWETGWEHKALHSGRGCGKTQHICAYEVLRADSEYVDIVNCREFQKSVHASSKRVVEYWISKLGLGNRFTVTRDEIWNRKTDSRFSFKGLRHNIDSIRGELDMATIVFVEEARVVSKLSMETLFNTVRQPNAEILSAWNPLDPGDPWDDFYRGPRSHLLQRAMVQRITVEDNAHFFNTRLPSEYWRLFKGNYAQWQHIYGGEYDLNPDTRIFDNVSVGVIGDNELAYASGPYYGMDFGSTDPSSIVKAWILADGKTLYVEKNGYERGLTLQQHVSFVNEVLDDPRERIVCDSAGRAYIQYLTGKGFNAVEAVKGPGSVGAGIKFLQGFNIVLHPECEAAQAETLAYKWKTNRLTGAKLKDPMDADNHFWDSLRYAMEDLMLEQMPEYAEVRRVRLG